MLLDRKYARTPDIRIPTMEDAMMIMVVFFIVNKIVFKNKETNRESSESLAQAQ